MKLHLSILKTLLELPSNDPNELRKHLDDLGLEVKGMEGEGLNTVFNIETLANRGDHLSALGVARELSARLLTTVSFPTLAPDFSGLRASIKLSVDTPLCSRFALLEVSQAKALALRPEILSCMADGVHPETPVVDLSNYLFLEMGHPTHAFDFDKIDGEIVVEALKKEEKIIALDNKEYTVPAGAIVVRDRKKVVSVAGVIGCANSMVTAITKRFLLEAALFDPVSIRKTARAMGISTDASYAFERGVDREAILTVLRRMVFLSTSIGNDGLQPHALSYFEGVKTEIRSVQLRLEEVRNQFNLPRYTDSEMQGRLKALGFTVSAAVEKNLFNVQVPSWRLWDIEKEADLIEELGRAMSLSQVKLDLPPLDYNPPEPSSIEQVMYALESPLHGLGFTEVMTKNLYSNEEVTLLESLEPKVRQQHVTIKNALEKNCSHLKVTNLIHLGRLFEANLKRGLSSFKVYENARLFKTDFAKAGHPYESEYDVLSLAFGGRVKNSEWKKPESVEENFYWFKGALEACFSKLKIKVNFEKSADALLHPGRQAKIVCGKFNIGFFGQMHPQLARSLAITDGLVYAELDLFLLAEAFEKAEKEIFIPSDYPEIVRDLTLKVPQQTFAAEVLSLVDKLEIENLKQSSLVDDFKRPDEAFRRVSYRFDFQSTERTLTSAEVDEAMSKMRQQLEAKGFSLAI